MFVLMHGALMMTLIHTAWRTWNTENLESAMERMATLSAATHLINVKQHLHMTKRLQLVSPHLRCPDGDGPSGQSVLVAPPLTHMRFGLEQVMIATWTTEHLWVLLCLPMMDHRQQLPSQQQRVLDLRKPNSTLVLMNYLRTRMARQL
jgi:hypothetical protein